MEGPFWGSASCPRTLRHGLGFDPPTFWYIYQSIMKMNSYITFWTNQKQLSRWFHVTVNPAVSQCLHYHSVLRSIRPSSVSIHPGFCSITLFHWCLWQWAFSTCRPPEIKVHSSSLLSSHSSHMFCLFSLCLRVSDHASWVDNGAMCALAVCARDAWMSRGGGGRGPPRRSVRSSAHSWCASALMSLRGEPRFVGFRVCVCVFTRSKRHHVSPSLVFWITRLKGNVKIKEINSTLLRNI